MNGRVYDPQLGRFLSPDPIVAAPAYSQSWNRYTYTNNNPLNATDPSGYTPTYVGHPDDGPFMSDCSEDPRSIAYGRPWLCDQIGVYSPDDPFFDHYFDDIFDSGWDYGYDYWDYGYPYGGVFVPSTPPSTDTPVTAQPSGSVSDNRVHSEVYAAASLKQNAQAAPIIYRSPEWMRLVIPGQIAWDNALTKFYNGEAGSGLLYTGQMLAEAFISVYTLGSGSGALQGTRATQQTLTTTLHGAERIAGTSATRGGVLSLSEILQAQQAGTRLRAANGAIVHVVETQAGRFNVVVSGEKGIITTLKNISQKSLDKLGRNYGWWSKL